MKPLIVNLFAPPGSGKSTTASGLFYNLKNQGVNCELAGEYAKILTWSKRQHALQDQFYVFGKQHHRVWTLSHDCDVIICDSPILLALAYADGYPQCFYDTISWSFNQYNNINFYINRVKPYNPKGRNQTEEESNDMSIKILRILWDNNVDFTEIDGDEEGLSTITRQVMQKIQS
jgi:hypothetical protein